MDVVLVPWLLVKAVFALMIYQILFVERLAVDIRSLITIVSSILLKTPIKIWNSTVKEVAPREDDYEIYVFKIKKYYI